MIKQDNTILKVTNLTKTYNLDSPEPVHALKGVSVEFKSGEFVALMGRSGSGKSTFLHQVALLDVPTSGDIQINDRFVSDMSDEEKTKFRLNFIGYIFQDYALLSELTLFENVALPMQALGFSRDKYEQDVLSTIEKVGLTGLEHHLPSELSGGQQQRVSIARAIVNKPAILFADEPTANLDSESSEIVLNTIKNLADEYNQTIIMVTHESDDMKYVDRVIWLKDGNLQDE
jgi:putative ABC transport system ATP-binding protein